MDHGFFRCILFNFHIFGDFLDILLLICNLNPLWVEIILCMIIILVKVLTVVCSNREESTCNAGDLCSILVWEDSLDKEMATHSSVLAWAISWIEELGRLQFMGLQWVRHNWVTNNWLLIQYINLSCWMFHNNLRRMHILLLLDILLYKCQLNQCYC